MPSVHLRHLDRDSGIIGCEELVNESDMHERRTRFHIVQQVQANPLSSDRVGGLPAQTRTVFWPGSGSIKYVIRD